MSDEPTERFTSRVADYVRYRPTYPQDVFDLLKRECGLGPQAKVADAGSGTGIFARALLETGAEVYAVEPNEAMRVEAERTMSPPSPGDSSWERGKDRFHSIDATAESTGLPDASIDLVTAAQAFHWFDKPAARREFVRILRPQGHVALVWNERSEDATPFLRGYERLLQCHSDDYLRVRHRAISPDDLNAWFGGTMRAAAFVNRQRFDYGGVLGRLMSSSYAPQPGDPRHDPMVADLRRLFDETEADGEVEFVYETNVYYGPLA